MAQNFSALANLIWSVADLLRGDYKQADYGKVVLPFTLMRRLDCVLESTKAAVLAEYEKRKTTGVNLDPFLRKKSGLPFYNTSSLTFPGLLADPANIRQNCIDYLGAFSADVRDVFERFKFQERIVELDEKELLFLIVQSFADVDLHPTAVPNESMGLVFEELIRKFAEASNETAGEHFTPREVIKLIVECLFSDDDEALTAKGVVRSMYDPTAGTGGILSVAEALVRERNDQAKLVLFGQELNDESYAICKADMLIKGQDPKNIVRGNTLSQDGFAGEKFDYQASNPPFGVDWKKVQDFVANEHKTKGFGGRFGPGLPRVSDGSMLFLLHLIEKMRPAAEGGGRIGIVLNGSPLFTGDAGSGESEIRRWILENDLLDAIIALPTDLFYNTGIATYVWILDNDKRADRKGKVQLIDATRMYAKMKKSLGNKRVYITDAQIDEIVQAYCANADGVSFKNEFVEEAGEPRVAAKTFDRTFFGYRKVTVDRPLRLVYQATTARIEQLAADKSWLAALKKAKAKPEDYESLANLAARGLRSVSDKLFFSETAFRHAYESACAAAGIKLVRPLIDAVAGAMSFKHPDSVIQAKAEVVASDKSLKVPDPELRDTENIPLSESIKEYMAQEVLPHVPDAWVNETIRDEKDGQVGKVGYEINFNRYFYVYKPPRPPHVIAEEIREMEKRFVELMRGVVA